jgi:hypothetical protein
VVATATLSLSSTDVSLLPIMTLSASSLRCEVAPKIGSKGTCCHPERGGSFRNFVLHFRP